MVKSNKSNLKEEERLAEEVRKLPHLYDIDNAGYTERNRKNNALSGVENACGFDEGT